MVLDGDKLLIGKTCEGSSWIMWRQNPIVEGNHDKLATLLSIWNGTEPTDMLCVELRHSTIKWEKERCPIQRSYIFFICLAL
jgi:hypothetical protein